MERKYRNAAERIAHRDKCEAALAGMKPEKLVTLIDVCERRASDAELQQALEALESEQ